MAHQHMKLLQR